MVVSDLNEGENSFRRLSENLPGIVYRVLIEDDNRMIFFNDMIQTMTGYNPEDLEKGTVCSIDPLILPEDRLNVINIVKDAIENNVPFEVEYRINNKSGELKWFFERGRPIRGDNGNPCYIDGVIFDITERKEIEQKLKESEKKFKLFYEDAPLGYQSLDFNGNILEVNKAWINFFGYSKEEVIGKFFGDFIDSEYLEVFNTNIHKFKETGEICEEEFGVVKKDGSHAIVLFDGNISYDENGNFKQIHCIFQDITEQRNAEQKIIQEREKADLYLNVVEVILVALDVDGKITLINKKGHELLGYKEGELIGKNWFEICLPPHDRKRVYEYFKKLMAGEVELIKFYENPIQAKNGEEKLISWSTVLFKDENGNITGLLSSGEDITERKKAEMALQRSEAQKTAILNAITTNIAFVNKNLEILWVNKASCDSVNRTPEEMIGHRCHEFWADPQEPCKRCPTLKVFKTKKTEHVIMITPDGRVWDEKGEPVFDNIGNLVGVIEIAHEITKKYQTERALQKSRASLARAQRIVHLGNWDWDVEKDVLFWSDELYRIFGLVPQEFNATYEVFLNSVHPEDREFVKKSVNEILYEQKPYSIEYRIVLPDSSERIVHERAEGIFDRIGRAIYISGTNQDITERKKTEEKLKESEQKYKDLANLLPQVICETDVQGNLTFVNQNAYKVFGYTQDDFNKGLNALQMISPKDRERTWRNIKRLLNRENIDDVEYMALRKDGSLFPVIAYASPIIQANKSVGLRIILIDASNLKKIEDELRKSEERYRYLIENSLEGVWVIDSNANTILINPSMAKMLGYTIEEMIGKSLFLFMNEKEIEITKINLERRKKGISEERDSEMIHKNGKKVYLRIRASPIFDIEGNYEGTFAFLSNISQRKLTEQNLIESEEKFRNLTEQSLIGVAVIQNNVFKYVNQRYAEIGGYTIEEMINWQPGEFIKTVHPADREKVMEQSIKKQRGDKNVINQYTFQAISKTGEAIWIELSSKTIMYESRLAILITIIDITDRKKAEQKLKSEKEKAQKYLDIAGVVIIVLNADQTVQLINQKGCEILEEEESNIIGMNWFDNFIPEKVRGKIKEVFYQIMNGKFEQLEYYENAVISKNGNKRIISWHNRTLKNEAGHIIGTLSSGLDITARKQSEESLKESEEKYRYLFNNAQVGLYWSGITDGKILECNNTFAKLLGYDTREECVADNNAIEHYIDPKARSEMLEEIRANKEVKNYEIHITKRDGTPIWLSISARMFEKENRIEGAAIDITERKRIENQLRSRGFSFQCLHKYSRWD